MFRGFWSLLLNSIWSSSKQAPCTFPAAEIDAVSCELTPDTQRCDGDVIPYTMAVRMVMACGTDAASNACYCAQQTRVRLFEYGV